ncbi:protein S100-B-like isoform X2 [Corythoichthys intestinalis]|uniref:protein S100-B-like isoform X2 n=1 Tax=Corythoichthys intestinalis TaxID=161448 RepID=UPI0025A5DCEF|nr:protein S100-B-like isoform X2 [Corythoichthys intestinalis]
MEISKDCMSNLESGMVTIIRAFKKYSGEKGHLKKAELKALIHNEMSHFIKKMHKKELDELFANLDQNSDLEIDFKEFVAFIAMVTSACQELFTPFHESLACGV